MAFSTGFEGALEEVRAQLLKPGPSYGSVELDSLKQGINLNVGLGGSRQSPLGALTGCAAHSVHRCLRARLFPFMSFLCLR